MPRRWPVGSSFSTEYGAGGDLSQQPLFNGYLPEPVPPFNHSDEIKKMFCF